MPGIGWELSPFDWPEFDYSRTMSREIANRLSNLPEEAAKSGHSEILRLCDLNSLMGCFEAGRLAASYVSLSERNPEIVQAWVDAKEHRPETAATFQELLEYSVPEWEIKAHWDPDDKVEVQLHTDF